MAIGGGTAGGRLGADGGATDEAPDGWGPRGCGMVMAATAGAAGGFGGATVFRGGGLETAGLTSEAWTGWDSRRALCSTLG